MSVNPTDLLNLADRLSHETHESDWRGSISRAYYASYHFCKSWHNNLPQPGSLGRGGGTGGLHADLIQQMTNPSNSLTNEVWKLSKSKGFMLRDLRNRRTDADYNLQIHCQQKEAGAAVSTAQNILTKT